MEDFYCFIVFFAMLIDYLDARCVLLLIERLS